MFRKKLEATTGFEPVNSGFADRRLNHLATSPIGAEDEIRTRDLLLGKKDSTTELLSPTYLVLVPRRRFELLRAYAH